VQLAAKVTVKTGLQECGQSCLFYRFYGTSLNIRLFFTQRLSVQTNNVNPTSRRRLVPIRVLEKPPKGININVHCVVQLTFSRRHVAFSRRGFSFFTAQLDIEIIVLHAFQVFYNCLAITLCEEWN